MVPLRCSEAPIVEHGARQCHRTGCSSLEQGGNSSHVGSNLCAHWGARPETGQILLSRTAAPKKTSNSCQIAAKHKVSKVTIYAGLTNNTN
jgi:hypothetical protein